MPTPALDKVLVALAATLNAWPALAAATFEIDRADDEALGNAELPHGNVQHDQTSFEQFTHGETLHRAAVSIDMIVSVEASATNGAKLRVFEADIVAALWADRTLGGCVQDIVPGSSSGTENVLADEGGRTLSIEILFLTPVGDHFTLIGAAGLIP
jgi:hypothetical protein